MTARVAVVDAADRFLRWADRAEVHRDRLVHRSVHVLLFNSAGRLVVQKRHRDKLTFPGHWDVSCSGHVEEPDYPRGPDDELSAVYAACAARELCEELGVRVPLERLGHFAPEPGVHYEQIELYRGTSDGPFVAQAEEVEEVRAVTAAQLGALAPQTATLRWFTGWALQRGVFPPPPSSGAR